MAVVRSTGLFTNATITAIRTCYPSLNAIVALEKHIAVLANALDACRTLFILTSIIFAAICTWNHVDFIIFALCQSHSVCTVIACANDTSIIGTAKTTFRFLENAIELDVDCISDGETTVIGAILEHVEPAGCHSGDSASITPPVTLSAKIQDKIREYAHEFARALHVNGLMNIQLAVKDGEIYMIEVNPRASRTIPFVSKAIGVHLAGLAALCMTGSKLRDLGFTREVKLPYIAVKEAVFPFIKFPGVDIVLTPEMKSTGEVMCLDRDRGIAYLKSQIAAGSKLPKTGNVFLSVKDQDKPGIIELARELVKLGFTIYATLIIFINECSSIC